jgi:hypothetical protein
MVSAGDPFKVGYASITNFSFCFKLTAERGAQATAFPATTSPSATISTASAAKPACGSPGSNSARVTEPYLRPHLVLSGFHAQRSGFAAQPTWSRPRHGLAGFAAWSAATGAASPAGANLKFVVGDGGGAGFAGFLIGAPASIFQESRLSQSAKLGDGGSPAVPRHFPPAD